MNKRAGALVLAAVMLLGAPGAIASGFDSLETAWTLRGLAGEVAFSITAWPDVTPETLAVSQSWLETLRLRLSLKGENSALGLHDGSRQVLLAETAADRLTLTVPGSLLTTEYVGSAEAPPLRTLFNLPQLPDVAPFVSLLPQAGEALLAGLLPYEKADDTRATLKNVGRADSRLVYVLSAEEANAWWQQTLPRLQPLWAEGTAGFPGAWRDGGAVILSTLRFTGRLTIRQLLDKEGKALGFQTIGNLEVLGQTRKLDLTAGYLAETGLHISLKLPATRGRDRLEALVSLAFAEKEGIRPIKGELSFTQVRGGDKLSLSCKVDLSLSPEGTGERLGGTLNLKLNRTGADEKKRDYLLTPDLLAREGGLSGRLGWVESEGKRLLRDVALDLALSAQDSPAPSRPQARVDLNQADPAALAYARRQASQALLPFLRDKLLALPLETRRLVLHDWGRVRRALAESSDKAQPAPETHLFTVVEDADTQPVTKEDLP